MDEIAALRSCVEKVEAEAKQLREELSHSILDTTAQLVNAKADALARAEKAETAAKQLRAFLDEVEQKLADSERALDVLTWMRVRRETDEALAGKGK